MVEGWFEDEYYVLFDDDESDEATLQYRAAELLPGYAVIGMLGWDDLLVRDAADETFSVPAVPLTSEYLRPYAAFPDPEILEADDRFTDKVKWYIQPLIFGGDPESQDNMVWITHAQHREVASFWNDKCQEVRSQQ